MARRRGRAPSVSASAGRAEHHAARRRARRAAWRGSVTAVEEGAAPTRDVMTGGFRAGGVRSAALMP